MSVCIDHRSDVVIIIVHTNNVNIITMPGIANNLYCFIVNQFNIEYTTCTVCRSFPIRSLNCTFIGHLCVFVCTYLYDVIYDIYIVLC